MAYIRNIEEESLQNDAFRKVLYTDPRLQLVLMSLKPGEEIGMEVHDKEDQFIRVEAGEGVAIIGEAEHHLQDGSVVIIPKGERHNITNTSADTSLKLYTIYAPAHHPEGTVHLTKEDADADEENH